MIDECTAALRFVKRDLKPSELYAGRPFKYVLQQKWLTRPDKPSEGPEGYIWRDVPCVEVE